MDARGRRAEGRTSPRSADELRLSTDFVLDTGALAALQRDRRRLLALVDLAHEEARALRTPAPMVTEFLGHSPGRLRLFGEYVVSRMTVSSFTEPLARRAAVLIQRALDGDARARPSALDAIAAADAEECDAVLLFDGDRRDLEALADASGRLELRELRDLV